MKNSQHKDNLLFYAWATSVIALLGSLYFSEVLKYEPCEFCWFQRILMYPLVILMGIAIVRKDKQISYYILPLSIIGGSISLYHYLVQKVAFIGETATSCGIIPCTGQYINWFGFITIPFLALTAFVIITILNIMILKRKES